MASETIFAIATPPGFGGVGVIRISGPLAGRIAGQMLGSVPEPRYATLANFTDADGQAIDSGIALLFPAPASFTGEDVLELQGHGGPVVQQLLSQRIMERLPEAGWEARSFAGWRLALVADRRRAGGRRCGPGLVAGVDSVALRLSVSGPGANRSPAGPS